MPDWFDLDALRLTVSGAVVASAGAAIIVLVVVRRVVARLVLVLVLGGLAIGGVLYASTLDDCEARCDCRFFFDDLRVDGCVDPASSTSSGSSG